MCCRSSESRRIDALVVVCTATRHYSLLLEDETHGTGKEPQKNCSHHGISLNEFHLPQTLRLPPIFPYNRLVNVEDHRLWVVLPHLLIPVLQTNPHNPNRHDGNTRETDARHPRLQEPRVICARPQVRRVYTRHVTERVTQRESHSLLLRRLAERNACPAKHDVINAEGKGDEDENGNEARGNVGGDRGDDEADDDDALADGDVPSTLVVASGCVAHNDGHGGGKEIGGACECERGGCVVAEGFHDGGKEGLEADGRDVRVVHEAEDPGAPVCQRLTQAYPYAGRFFAGSCIGGNAVVR